MIDNRVDSVASVVFGRRDPGSVAAKAGSVDSEAEDAAGAGAAKSPGVSPASSS